MPLLGSTIGRIRLIELAGRGGMGEVFVGFDETLKRKVAVKCVSPDYRLNRHMAGRILREARILSRLAHPHICQIYDLVHQDEGDFLILELVDGEDLRQALKHGLDPKIKMGIAQQIADVLVATHAEGVIHRDLKPANVMLTGEGEVKVLDFGVARASDLESPVSPPVLDLSASEEVPDWPPSPRVTDGGTLIETRTLDDSMVGTPRYMSPEQAKEEPITPASDMYSFGLLLQELLTEQAPYQRRQPIPKLLTEVAAGRSRPVEGLDPKLTTLINDLKSLEPSQRPTAKEAADRLRHIRERPARRLRQALIGGVVLLLLAMSAKYTFDLQRERQAALAARDQAEDLVTFLIGDLSRGLEPLGKLDMLGLVAEKALEHFERSSRGDTGEAAFLRGQAFSSVSRVMDSQDDLARAMEAVNAAIQLHEIAVAEDPESAERRIALGQDYLMKGAIHLQLGHKAEAEESTARAYAWTQDWLAADPDNDAYLESHAEANYSYGLLTLFADDEVAEPYFQAAIELYQGLAEKHPDNSLYKYRLAVLFGQGLSQIHTAQGNSDASFTANKIAFEIYEDLLASGTFNSKWLHGFAWELRRRGGHLEERRRWQEALETHRKALQISERLLSFEPKQSRWRLGLCSDQLSIARTLLELGRPEEALAMNRQSLEIIQQMAHTEPTNVDYTYWHAQSQLGEGEILQRLGHSAAASWQKVADVTAEDAQSEEPDLYVLELRAIALLELEELDAARPAIAHLRQKDWFDGGPDKRLVALCERYGL